MIETQLPIELWKRGEAVGLRRSRVKGDPAFEYDGDEQTNEKNHVYGARGEAAFAHALKIDWAGPVDTFTIDPDVEPNWEVRTTDSVTKLKVRPKDQPGRLVVFVLNERGSPVYDVIGYIVAGWAQQHLPAKDTRDRNGKWRKAPVHWVREYQLCPINPDFHLTHGWAKDKAGRWACAFCPARMELVDGQWREL